MNALRCIVLMAAVGVATLAFLPTPATASGGAEGAEAARILECELAKMEYEEAASACLYTNEPFACNRYAAAFYYAISVCGPYLN